MLKSFELSANIVGLKRFISYAIETSDSSLLYYGMPFKLLSFKLEEKNITNIKCVKICEKWGVMISQ